MTITRVFLGTHDIQRVQIDDQNGLITFEYAGNSKARGAFCILLFLGDDGTVNFNRSVYVVVQRNSTTRLQIARGARTVLAVFDVEYNGLLQTSQPAVIIHNATGGMVFLCSFKQCIQALIDKLLAM